MTEENNLNKIVQIGYLDKENVPREKLIYLLDEVSSGKGYDKVEIAGRKVSCVAYDRPEMQPLMTCEVDDVVQLGEYFATVKDIFTEDELLEREAARQEELYHRVGMIDSDGVSCFQYGFTLNKPN